MIDCRAVCHCAAVAVLPDEESVSTPPALVVAVMLPIVPGTAVKLITSSAEAKLASVRVMLEKVWPVCTAMLGRSCTAALAAVGEPLVLLGST